jgi:hypothetical protein
MTGGVVGVVTDLGTARSYVDKMVPETSKFVIKLKVTADTSKWESWYFKMGHKGNTGDGILSEIGTNNNDYKSYVKDSEVTVTVPITAAIKNKISSENVYNSNVQNDWHGMLGLQGYNVTVQQLQFVP